jgi:cytochrome c oxidase assembly protein subunit 15
MRAFARFAWSALAVNVLVIAWGALVRATGSGAGCGRHWPLCDGQVLPRSPGVEMAIELTHRATSGLALVLVVALFVWARRVFARGHAARAAAGAALTFIVVEALLGAGLVLFGWVAKDASAGRGWAMALHLANTFFLLGALALVAGWSGGEGRVRLQPGGLTRLLACSLVALLLAGVSGAVAALGDTLFPAVSFTQGLADELAGGAHLLLRLRVLHPFTALVAAGLVVVTAAAAARQRDARVQQAALLLAVLVLLQLVAGVANLLLLAPVWMQLVHLVLADATWIALVLMGGWSMLGEGQPARVKATPRAAHGLG